ncbi:MAG: HD domain-containing protein [Promethearchaeota archaeon]
MVQKKLDAPIRSKNKLKKSKKTNKTNQTNKTNKTQQEQKNNNNNNENQKNQNNNNKLNAKNDKINQKNQIKGGDDVLKDFNLDKKSKDEYILENLQKLRAKFPPEIKFEYIKRLGIIKVIEDPAYYLNSHPDLKQNLKVNLNMQFSKEHLWHIPKDQVEKLGKGLIKSFTRDELAEMKETLYKYIDSIDDEKLKEEIKRILEDNSEFFEKPAATNHHHNYRGGLIEHTIEVYELALSMAKVVGLRRKIDYDLLKAGAILHDIGKVNCYSIDNTDKIEVTTTFKMQDHIINGIKIISQYISDNEVLDQLIHIIASHHQLQEWGSPIRPITPEAWIIHFSDNLSAQAMGQLISP